MYIAYPAMSNTYTYTYTQWSLTKQFPFELGYHLWFRIVQRYNTQCEYLYIDNHCCDLQLYKYKIPYKQPSGIISG